MDEFFPAEISDSELVPLVCFRLGAQQCAVAITSVREVLRVTHITPVPQMPDFVLGIINVRGNILPVFDVRRKFGLALNPWDEKAKIVVADAGAAQISFVADELLENVKIERASIALAPYGRINLPPECVAGIGHLDDRRVAILNLSRMYEFILEDIRSLT